VLGCTFVFDGIEIDFTTENALAAGFNIEIFATASSILLFGTGGFKDRPFLYFLLPNFILA
jgi:hypothetical protein